ncbi:MAG: ABC transporter permease, partial [Actinobacteria bacterium]|nr:ABC transporter permease [Actinomycetota bacterium]
MYRLTIRQLWAHKLRFALTGLAVVLGVAFMSGTTVLTDTMSKTFDDLFATANADVDVVVQQPATMDSATVGEVRGRVPAALVDEVRRVDGVAEAAGTVQGYAQLVRADGSVASTDGIGMTIGANWTDAALSPFDLADGRAPATGDEAVLDVATARDQGWEIGDRFSVLTADGPVAFSLVGTVTLGDIEGIPGSSLVATTDARAQEVFGEPGTFDTIVVAGTDGTDPVDLSARIDDALGTGTYDVMTGEEDTANEQDQFHEDLAFMSSFLLAFAYVSLFVGVFIIYNTFSIVVAQRKRDMAMLRAIGASRRQLLRSVLLESTIVGVVASAIGLAGGVLMSMGLRALLGAVGLDIPDGDLVISSGTITTAFVVGIGVTILSAIAPAIRAGRVAPIAALREVSSDRSATSIVRTIAGLLVTGLGVAAFAAGVAGDGSDAVSMLAMGAVAVVLGVFVLGPVIARPVVAAIGSPLPRLSGTVGRLARENARRNPKRTSATASALMIGVALVGFITILAASTERSVEAAVDRSMRADYVVDSGAWAEGGFSPRLAEAIAAEPELATVSPYRGSPAVVDGRTGEVQAVETSTFGDLFDLEFTQGDLASVAEGSIAVKDDVAAEHHLALGDRMEVQFPDGTTSLEVAAIYQDDIAGADATDYVVDLSTFEANVADQFDRKIFVGAADGVSAEASRAALDAVTADYANAEVLDQAQFKESITSGIHQMLNLIYGLLALAV